VLDEPSVDHFENLSLCQKFSFTHGFSPPQLRRFNCHSRFHYMKDMAVVKRKLSAVALLCIAIFTSREGV
jgi:hypothetical protein